MNSRPILPKHVSTSPEQPGRRSSRSPAPAGQPAGSPPLVDKTCRDTEYFTPERVLEPVRAYFGGQIDLDPATHSSNPTQAEWFLTREDGADGFRQSWRTSNVFVNPPFGKELRIWLNKIREEAAQGAHIIALLPGQRFEQKYFQNCIFTPELTSICFVQKRLSFLGLDGKPRKGNPYGSMLYLFNGHHELFRQHLLGLGYVMRHVI